MSPRELKIFAGNANRRLARAVCNQLEQPLCDALVTEFKNGETRVRIEEHVRGRDVFVIQPTSVPCDHHIMELLLMIDALKRASADRITAVVPYYGYAKQEKKTTGREPISAKLVANLITVAGASRVLAVDLHAPAIQGFFDIPVDNLTAMTILADQASERFEGRDIVVVSPDTGGVARANDFRTRIGANVAIISKHRPMPDQNEVIEMVGAVNGKIAVIVDDMISTGGTLSEAADLLHSRGAVEIHVYATHAALAQEAPSIIGGSKLDSVTITDTIEIQPDLLAKMDDKIRILSVAPLIASAIRRIYEDQSVSALFMPRGFRQAELLPR
jgi:ribose-phosphate pyrophosphokinase